MPKLQVRKGLCTEGGPQLSPSLAIVVCSAPMARSRARRSRAMTAAGRLAMLKREART
jgi:hypothetical protein